MPSSSESGPPSGLDLLPPPGTAPRCAPFARTIEVDPGGSALAVELVVVADVALPWPKPVFAHPDLEGLTGSLETPDGPARLLASVPPIDRPPAVRVWARTPEGAVTVRVARDDTSIAETLGPLLDGGLGTFADAHRSTITEAEPAVLICTQGSHDVCCGSEGARFADAAARHWPEGSVFRVSHTGGHRFAPTAMTFPDGRMWAHLGPEHLALLLDGIAEPASMARHCRGWWGAPKGAGQVAERAVWARSGHHDPGRTVTVDGATVHVVDPDGRRWHVEVEPGREVPTIACRADGGLPAKPGREWRLVSIEESA